MRFIHPFYAPRTERTGPRREYELVIAFRINPASLPISYTDGLFRPVDGNHFPAREDINIMLFFKLLWRHQHQGLTIFNHSA